MIPAFLSHGGDLLSQWWHNAIGANGWMVVIGFLGQSMFFMRFLVQWIASERAGRSIIPDAFWYFSLAGGGLVLLYGLLKPDIVIIAGQLPGTVIYIRNLYLSRRHHAAA